MKKSSIVSIWTTDSYIYRTENLFDVSTTGGKLAILINRGAEPLECVHIRPLLRGSRLGFLSDDKIVYCIIGDKINFSCCYIIIGDGI